MIVYLSTTLSNIAKQPVAVSSTPYPIPDGEDISLPYNHFYITMPSNIDTGAFMVFAQYYVDKSSLYPFGPCAIPGSTVNSHVYCIMNETLTIRKNGDFLQVIIKIKDAYCDSMSGIYQFSIGHYLGLQVNYEKAQFVPKQGYQEYFPVGMDKNAFNVAGISFQQQKISLAPGLLSRTEEKVMYKMMPSAVNYAVSDCHSELSGASLGLTVPDGIKIDAHFYKATDFISLMTAFAGFVYGVAAFVVSMFFAVQRKWAAGKELLKKNSTRTPDIENQAINQSETSILALKGRNRGGDLSFSQEGSPNKDVDSFLQNTPNPDDANKDKSGALEIDQEGSQKSKIPAILPAQIQHDS